MRSITSNELEGFKTNLYFTNFKEGEMEDCLKINGFKVVSVKTRRPYDFEIPVDRIYAIGEKTVSA